MARQRCMHPQPRAFPSGFFPQCSPSVRPSLVSRAVLVIPFVILNSSNRCGLCPPLVALRTALAACANASAFLRRQGYPQACRVMGLRAVERARRIGGEASVPPPRHGKGRGRQRIGSLRFLGAPELGPGAGRKWFAVNRFRKAPLGGRLRLVAAGSGSRLFRWRPHCS